MALICETGAIVAGAESYCSVSEADTYHAKNSNTTWIGADAVKEAALRKAARYLDGHYRGRWMGYRVQPITQTMEWPRLYVPFVGAAPGLVPGHEYASYLPSNAIPQRLKEAQCELALRALSGDLAADLTASVRRTRSKIDVIENEYEYTPGAKAGQLEYQIVDQLLSDYLKPAGSIDLVRG
ncbi:MAG: DnaT-like ssDNA-binding protein [Desulfuromonadales bacterium]